MGCNISTLSEEQEKEIHTMFFGPYKKEWKDKKGIVDNTDSTIAKRMKLETSVVANVITRICKAHFKKVLKNKQVKNK